MQDPLLTKVLATVGPASSEPETIERMIRAGVGCFRVNFSHGDKASWAAALSEIRRASAKLEIPVATLGDLPGPKVRLEDLSPEGLLLQPGQRVEFGRSRMKGQASPAAAQGAPLLRTTYGALVDEVKPGQAVLVDDGSVRLVCVDVEGEGEDRKVICEVVNGGLVTSGKGVNLPDTRLSLPSLTERDRICVRFAVAHEFDFLALSFVREAADLEVLRELLDRESDASGRCIPIISKIERPQALGDLEAIVEASDGIIVARGDLGVEMDLADVPVAQKRIVALCHDYGRPVIVATQMLQSMVESPTPTRAEVSDVANAVFDGADGVLLSGETAVGRWPVEAVEMIARVASRANRFLQEQPPRFAVPSHVRPASQETAALARGVGTILEELDARLVLMWAGEHGTARFLSQNRLSRPIVAFSDDRNALRSMALHYGVVPVYLEEPQEPEAFMRRAEEIVLAHGWAVGGERVVFVLGGPPGSREMGGLVRIHRLGIE